MFKYLYIVRKSLINSLEYTYNAPETEYDNIINYFIQLHSVCYETYCNRELTNCDIIFKNSIIKIKICYDYEPRTHLQTDLERFYSDLKTLKNF